MLQFKWDLYTHNSFLCEWVNAVPVSLCMCVCICFRLIFSSILCETNTLFLWPQKCGVGCHFCFSLKKHRTKNEKKNCPFVSFIFETTSATVSQQDMKRALMLFMERNYELLCNQYLANFGSAIMDTNEIIQRNFNFPRKSTIQIQMKKM